MSGRSRRAVHFYREDGFLVRGTLDPCTALGWAVGEDADFEERYWVAEIARRDEHIDAEEGPPAPDVVAELADLCHELIRTARPGLYRMNPASREDPDGYTWFTGRVSKPGRGVFEGVEFQ